MASPQDNVFVSRGAVFVRQIADGMKVASVSSFNGAHRLHVRRYYGETELKFPTKDGVVLTRQEYQHLVSMQAEIMAAFDKLQTEPNNQTQAVYTPPPRDVYSQQQDPRQVKKKRLSNSGISM